MIGEKLNQILIDLGYTPEEFADSIDVGKSAVYKLLRGDTKKITMKMADKISVKHPKYDRKFLLSWNDRGEENIPSESYFKRSENPKVSENGEEYKKTIEERIASEVSDYLDPRLSVIERALKDIILTLEENQDAKK